MEPAIFEPRLKFKPRLKFFKFGHRFFFTQCAMCIYKLKANLFNVLSKKKKKMKLFLRDICSNIEPIKIIRNTKLKFFSLFKLFYYRSYSKNLVNSSAYSQSQKYPLQIIFRKKLMKIYLSLIHI